MQLPPEKIAEIRERTDVVAFVGEYVALKRVGGSFRGLCPFHSEKSPSFYVHPGRQFYHCFGCQASGDVFSFAQKIDGRSFPEVARALAERAGVELPAEDAREDAAVRQARQRRERLLAVTDAAAGYYLRMLREHPLGPMARRAIEARGVSPEVAETYRLGYAPNGWDGLTRYLAQKGHSPRDAEEAGLLVPRKSGDGHYDRFRHRLMFPISDVHGHIVAFSGRALETPPGEEAPAEPPAKYVNSPEGPLYHKGELLFGLHEARVALRREGVGILCEGNFDVVAVHQAGLAQVVAPLGTAFTLAQAKLLRRYVSSVVLCFDGDGAGRKATAAAYPLLAEAGLPARVASLPRGEDPDSFVRGRGPEALRLLVERAVPIVEHLIEAAAEVAGTDPAARASGIESLGPVLAAVSNPVEARLYTERVAAAFQISDLEAVRAQLRRGARSGTRPARRPDAGGSASEGASAAAGPRPGARPPGERPREGGGRAPALEKDVVGAYLDAPDLFASVPLEKALGLLTNADLRAILRLSAGAVGARGVVDGPTLLALMAEQSAVTLAARRWVEERLAVQTFDAASARAFVDAALPLLRKQAIERELLELKRAAMECLRAGDAAQAELLMKRRDVLFRAGQGRAEGPDGAQDESDRTDGSR